MVGLDLSDDVPFAIGSVQGAHFRVAAQVLDHAIGFLPGDLDQRHGADGVRFGFRFEPNREATNDAIFKQFVDAVLHRAARHAQRVGKAGYRRAGIVAQDGEEPVVRIVEGHFSIISSVINDNMI
jgi:hypothetical protein